MIGLQNKTRYFNSTFKDAPQIINEYGTLVKALDKILCKGFNYMDIISTEILPDNKIKINLPVTHGYLEEQVIQIENAEQEYFNQCFRVLDSSANYIVVGLPKEIIEVSIASSLTTLKIKTAPLGFSKVYESSDSLTMCFKNTSLDTPGILKVIDKLPPNGYDNSWSKYARVVMGQSINESGDFINNIKAPYHPDFPDAENTGNKVVGSGGTFGFAKWHYASDDYSHWYEIRTPAGSFPRRWEIIGDSNTFYLLLVNNSWDSCNCGFGNIYSEEGLGNLALQARDGFFQANSYRQSSRYGKDSTYWGNLLDSSLGSFLFSDIYGSSAKTLRYVSTGLYIGESYKDRPWLSTDVKNYNPFTGDILTGKLYIKDDQGFDRGYHRGLNILYGSDYPNAGRLWGTSYRLLKMTDPLRQGNPMPLLFTMEDWEDV